MVETPAVPLTIEGSWTLHQMFRWKQSAWRALEPDQRASVVAGLAGFLRAVDEPRTEGHPNQSALYSMVGHKADLLLIHFRDTLSDLHATERQVAGLAISDYLEQTTSYVSVVELGLYESTGKTYSQLIERGLQPFSTEWNEGVAEVLARQTAAMAPRLFPAIPAARYICFYPMDRKRGEEKNWYQVRLDERQRMMHEHGMIGRRYADSVRQIITGSIGFDDWEWGVDLFAEDPVVFKKLIYEMRFDEVSAVYALFGTFYVGERVRPESVPAFLNEFTGQQ